MIRSSRICREIREDGTTQVSLLWFSPAGDTTQVSDIIDSDLHECEKELFKRAGSNN
jgi:hypothetical protein